jgi:hypothetical protein
MYEGQTGFRVALNPPEHILVVLFQEIFPFFYGHVPLRHELTVGFLHENTESIFVHVIERAITQLVREYLQVYLDLIGGA